MQVKYIKGKNIGTKSDGSITIWIETNEETFNTLRAKRNNVFILTVHYKDFNQEFKSNISNEGSSIIWKEDHGVFKIDIIDGDIIPPFILINGEVGLKI